LKEVVASCFGFSWPKNTRKPRHHPAASKKWPRQNANYYSCPRVERNARRRIKKAYRKLAGEAHPDKNPGDKNGREETFKERAKPTKCSAITNKRRPKTRFGHRLLNPEDGMGGGGGWHELIPLRGFSRRLARVEDGGVGGGNFRKFLR